MTSTKEFDAEQYEQKKKSGEAFRLKDSPRREDLEQTTSPVTKLVRKFQ